MNNKKYKLAFMGTSDFAVPILKRFLSSEFLQITHIFSKPPSKAGRGLKTVLSPISKVAIDIGIAPDEPASLKEVQPPDVDFVFVCAYGLFLPRSFTDNNRFLCLNAHPSLLPDLRGAAPIQRAIMRGDEEFGVTILKVSDKMDAGDILSSRKLFVPRPYFGSLSDKLSDYSAELAIDVLRRYVGGDFDFKKQDESMATYAGKINPMERRINWNDPAVLIDRKIRALSPLPGAFCMLDNEILKVIEADVYTNNQSNNNPGFCEIIDQGILVNCGLGKLIIKHIQRAGKRSMGALDFNRGYKGTQMLLY